MRLIIFFLLLSSVTKAQTWTVTRLRDSVLEINKRITAIQAKQALKDINDSIRNVKIKRLQGQLDSAGIYYNEDDFDIDTTSKKLSLKPKQDTAIIIFRSKKPTQQLVMAQRTRNAITKKLAKPDPIASTAQPSLTVPYTIGNTGLTKEQQDIADLKWQISYFEKLLDDDVKIIDKLQKKIDELQAKLKKH